MPGDTRVGLFQHRVASNVVGISNNKYGYQSPAQRARQRPTLHAQNQAWRARRQASFERFQVTQQATAGMFNTTMSQTAGLVELTYQKMASNFRAELAAKAAEKQKEFDALTKRLDVSI